MATVDNTAKYDRLINVNLGERNVGVVTAVEVRYSDFSSSGDIVQAITIPANSFVENVWAVISEAFDGTSPALVVGTGANNDGFIDSDDLDATDTSLVGTMKSSNGSTNNAAYAKYGARPFYSSADTLDVVFTYSGTPTAGKLVLIAEIITVPVLP